MWLKNSRVDLNYRTHKFIREQIGLDLSQVEAEEIRRSLVQYCLTLLDIAQEQVKGGYP
jgi:hypothetical protein